MNNRTDDQQINVCCATFYESDVVRILLGDVLHPGGLALTHRLGEVVGLSEKDRVLDVACGRGASAVYLARSFGCHVTGVDYGPQNVAAAEAHGRDQRMAQLTSFRLGDAEGLPFDDGTFDVLISECSFCTFPNKRMAAAEMARVLSTRGRLGLTDMTVNGPLPDDIQSLLAWVACVAGAGTPSDYQSVLEGAGFDGVVVEDHRPALLDMVNRVRRKLLAVELAAGLGKLDLGDIDLSVAKSLARRALELIEGRVAGYTLIAAKKV